MRWLIATLFFVTLSNASLALERRSIIATLEEYRIVQAGVGTSQVNQAAQDSSAALQRLIGDIIDAIRTKDSLRALQLIGSLVISDDASWFMSQFEKNTVDLLMSAYNRSMKDFDGTTRRLYEADIARGPISINVSRYADLKTAPEPIAAILQSMKTPYPLYGN